MEKAAFALKNYIFKKVNIDFSSIEEKSNFLIRFNHSGIFNSNTNTYSLTIIFSALDEKNENLELINIECEATFVFSKEATLETIPEYFYANSIAIIFPYVRAFVSTVTLQANISPVVLPTLNLTSLKEKLKEHSRSI